MAAALVGCKGGTTTVPINLLQSIALAPGQTAALGTPLRFVLGGVGQCGTVRIDWGDGFTEPFGSGGFGIPIDLTGAESQRTVTHTFGGWRGGKTVTVTATSGCEGTARLRFHTVPAAFEIGWIFDPTKRVATCFNAPAVPVVQRGMLVHVTGASTPIVSFCPLGCKYDPNGKLGSSAASNFPFPGFREFSLIVRLSPQVVQGGTGTATFTAGQAGMLELCQNDGALSDNKGGWQIEISADELGP